MVLLITLVDVRLYHPRECSGCDLAALSVADTLTGKLIDKLLAVLSRVEFESDQGATYAFTAVMVIEIAEIRLAAHPLIQKVV